jgi:TM2 domain-containing membrane protein YozV
VAKADGRGGQELLKVSWHARVARACSRTFQEEDMSETKLNSGVAAVLSLVIPGAGQMYRGRIAAGLLWLFATAGGYLLCVVPGLVLHLLCIFKAARG